MLDCRSACVPFVQGPQFVAYCAPFLFPYHLLSDVKPPCALPRSICSTARNRVPATIACHGCDELGSSTRRLTISDLSDVDRGRRFVGIPRSVSEYFGVFSLLRVIRPELFSCTRLTLRLDADSLGNRQKFSPGPSSVSTRPYSAIPSASLSLPAQRFFEDLPLNCRTESWARPPAFFWMR